jgi:hypothetical protein
MLRRVNIKGERGGVLIIVAVFLPILLMFGTFVLDVGNWFEHKRHLQLQVDAGALAGAGVFASPCSNAPIEQNSRRYAGDPNPDTSSLYNPAAGFYNPQVTNPDDVHVLINSTDFWNEGGSNFSDGGRPCQTRFVDVKATHDDLPWYFTVIPGADNLVDINAHARVEIRALDTLAGALPIAVNDVSPKSGAVLFVDETNGNQIIAAKPMLQIGASGGRTTWSNEANLADVQISSRSIGVFLAFSGAATAANEPIPVNTSGTLAEVCGRSLVDCYDLDLGSGVLYIRGWSPVSVGTASPPHAEDVWLTSSAADPATRCAGELGNVEFSTNTAACSNAVEARIALGISDPAMFEFVAYGADCPNAGCPLAYDSTSQTWKGAFPLAASAGPKPLELRWQRKGPDGTVIDLDGTGPEPAVSCTAVFRNNNPCSGSFGTVQRAFAAVDSLSGPVVGARLWNFDGAPAFDGPVHSYQIGTTHRLAVTATLAGKLERASDVNAVPVTLRVVGSQNGTTDCDPWNDAALGGPRQLKDEIAYGCRPTYTVNKGTPCTVAPYDGPIASWPQPPNWNCVETQTGGAIGAFVQGFNYRVHRDFINPACVNPNRFATQFPGFADQQDPRIVHVFLTPFGSFSGTGQDTVPVRAFATFYITGWGGNGDRNADPCNPTEPIPTGFLKGHFITYIQKLNDGGAGTEFCNLNDFGSCIAVLTR